MGGCVRQRQAKVAAACLAGWLAAAGCLSGARVQDVRDYGAKGDGISKDTAAIQAALDAAEKQGGGVVYVPPGRYLSGTIHLRSGITLELAPGSAIVESPDNQDFDPYEKLDFRPVDDKETTYFHYALLAGEDIHDIAIVGEGVIDGNRTRRGGPKPIALKNCQHVLVRGVRILNSPNYPVSLLGCDYVVIEGITILNSFADGIDPDSCRYVRISNCFVDSFDDAIVPKASMALGHPRATEHLTVTNCTLSSSCYGLKLGTESSGGFKDIAFSNCALFRRPREAGGGVIAGVALESVDGAAIEGVVISNIVMKGVDYPIFIRLGNRGRGQPTPTPGSLQDVSISNIVATDAVAASSITGLPGHDVRNVSLADIDIRLKGGGQPARGLDVPEVPAHYPEANMFGVLPAFGFYCRHAQGLTLRNVRVGWEQKEARPALLFDDVKDLDLDGFKTGSPASEPLVWLNQVAGAFIRGCRPEAKAEHFLRVTGSNSRDLVLIGNDLGSVTSAIEFASEVSKAAVSEISNRKPEGSRVH